MPETRDELRALAKGAIRDLILGPGPDYDVRWEEFLEGDGDGDR